MIRVLHIQRKRNNFFSVENLYNSIRSKMSSDILVTLKFPKFISKGIFRRIYIMFEFLNFNTDLYHVLGDIHFLTFFLNKNKTILTILDCVSLNRKKDIKYYIIYFFWYYLPIKLVGNIIVISNSTKLELIKLTGCYPEKIKVIPCCISDTFFEKQICIPIEKKTPIFLSIGTTKNKNLERIAESLVGIECVWIIIGNLSNAQFDLFTSLKLNFSNKKNISEADLIQVYLNSDILIFPSTYEGFGLPIVEANALGVPVITSKLYSMPEVANDAAIFVDPYNIKDIRFAVIDILSNLILKEQLIQNGYRNAERFKSVNIANQYANFYREIIQKLNH